MRAWPASDRCLALDRRIRARTGTINARATPAAATHNITGVISTAFSREKKPTTPQAHRSARPRQFRPDQPHSAAAGDAAGRLVQPRRASAGGEAFPEG